MVVVGWLRWLGVDICCAYLGGCGLCGSLRYSWLCGFCGPCGSVVLVGVVMCGCLFGSGFGLRFGNHFVRVCVCLSVSLCLFVFVFVFVSVCVCVFVFLCVCD